MRKIKEPFFFALTWGLMFFLCGPSYGQGKLTHRDTLFAQAKEKGSVRIIVTFKVPDLEKRQQTSRSVKVLPPGVNGASAEIARVKKADAALAEAIRTSALSVFRDLGLENKIVHIFNTVPQAVITVNNEDLLVLEESPLIMRVAEDQLIAVPTLTPETETDRHRGWGSYGVNLINAPQAWAKGYDGHGCYVAVLDTGVRTSHEAFTGKNIVEACFGTNIQGVSSSLCPGGAPEAEGPGSAVPPDRFGHGTHVSGIAVGNPPGDFKGVAPGADLIAVQVFSFIEDWWDVGSYFSDQIKGLEYVYGLRAAYSVAAANMSLGGGKYADYCDGDERKPIIDNLRAAGIAMIVSNGNEGYCGFLGAPACVSSAVAVGGSDYNDRAYVFNDWHPVMQDIFAPGVSIYSANATGDTDYSTRTGTSMAAPHVAGAWAVFRQSVPTATVSVIENAMKNSGIAVDAGCDTVPASGPRLDVAATLDSLLVPPIPTLSEWGFILFGLLLLGLTVFILRKRRGFGP